MPTPELTTNSVSLKMLLARILETQKRVLGNDNTSESVYILTPDGGCPRT